MGHGWNSLTIVIGSRAECSGSVLNGSFGQTVKMGGR
jgi:hypothetical protein